MSNTFVALDFETTGLAASNSRVVEIGAVKYQDGHEIDRFQTLVNPGVWSKSAARVHQIRHNDVLDAPTSVVAFKKLRNFIGSNLIVAHNCSFERQFLESEFRQIGLSVSNDFACTMQLSRIHIPRPRVPDHRLKTIVTHLNLRECGPLHRALPDALLCGQVWLILSNIANRVQVRN